MKNAESFNLRWDDFEANTRVALKELRDETEFCDVTLVCANGKQVSAHKVILAGGSKFFQQILKQNPHPHPLLYLKGVRYDYLLSILDFVYTGEANINQKEIESFFDVANDLQIKGLIDKNTPQKNSSKEGDMMSRNVSRQNDRSNVKKKAESPLHAETLHDKDVPYQNERSNVKKEARLLLHAETPHGNSCGSQSACEEGTIYTPFDLNIEVELDDTIYSTASFGTEANCAGLNDMMDFKTEVSNSYGIGSIFQSEEMANDWYEQSDDFIDDALRSNTDKFTSPDKILACEQKSDLFLHRYDGEPAENTNDKEFSTICFICGKSFRCNSQLKIHRRIHTGEKPFPCSFCPKAFRISSHLKSHTRIHTGEKPFPCSFCPKAFRQSPHLKNHLRIHTGEKPYQCSICGKSFRENSGLKIHTRIHTGEKPFPCSFCPKAFRKSGHLKSHSRIHTGEKF